MLALRRSIIAAWCIRPANNLRRHNKQALTGFFYTLNRPFGAVETHHHG